MNKSHNQHPFFKQTNPWNDNTNDIWLASTLRLYRNLSTFKFPNKLDKKNRTQIISLISNNSDLKKRLSNPETIKAENLTPQEKEYLYEHFLSSESFHHAHSGEAFILDDSGKFLLTLNIHEHLVFYTSTVKGDLENAWNQLVDMEISLGQTLNYAFNPKFGFLTANPNYCGTGLLTHVYLHLPALIFTSQIETLLKEHEKKQILFSSFQGEKNEFVGDILTLYNNCTIGLSSEDIINSLHTTATKLSVAEKSCRNQIKKDSSPLIRDKVSRAFGLLTHSYQLETKEALQAISLCKLGVELDWISGVDHKTLNNLFFTLRRAHLQQTLHEESSLENLPLKRAEFIKPFLENAQLSPLFSKEI